MSAPHTEFSEFIDATPAELEHVDGGLCPVRPWWFVEFTTRAFSAIF